MTSAENNVWKPPNLKFSGQGYPQTGLQGSCLRHSRECPPPYKKPSYGPVRYKMCSSVSQLLLIPQ